MNKCVFDEEDKCRALNEKDCDGCRFYKTKEELTEGREKAAERIAQLAPEHRDYIRRTYYGSKTTFKG